MTIPEFWFEVIVIRINVLEELRPVLEARQRRAAQLAKDKAPMND